MELSLLPHTTVPPQVLKGSSGGTVATHTSVCPTGALKFSLCDLKPTERCTCMFMEGHQSDPPIPVSPTAVFQRTDAPYRGSPHHLRKPTHEEGGNPLDAFRWQSLLERRHWNLSTFHWFNGQKQDSHAGPSDVFCRLSFPLYTGTHLPECSQQLPV